jgi:N-acetyl-1-D-myo-inositol-2-amino-2-deoxy-alpha-D-glucopyranoside deacetylase
MPGLLAFHAHPDDEVIGTGGVLARYSRAGEQVVVVTATDGAEGEIHNYEDPESLKPQLAEIRSLEIANALAVLGVKHHEFLGYRDSGMMGSEANAHPDAFWKSDFTEAVKRMMIIYDPFGGYGHPDHINVHRVGMAAFFGSRDLGWFPLEEEEDYWAPAKLYWTAWGRERMAKMTKYWEEEAEAGSESDQSKTETEPSAEPDESDQYFERSRRGFPDEEITTYVDVSEYVDLKTKALQAHRTQIPDDWILLRVPEEERHEVYGTESFVRIFSTVESPLPEIDLFAGLR